MLVMVVWALCCLGGRLAENNGLVQLFPELRQDKVEELLPNPTKVVGGGACCEAFPHVPFQPSNLLND